MSKSFFTIFFSFLLLTSFNQNAQPGNQLQNESELQKVAILSLKISRAENQYFFEITNSTIINSAKNIEPVSKTWSENDFVGFVLNEQKKVTDTIVIVQPLKARYEFPTNDQTIGSSTTDLTENEVVLRFKFNAEMKFLRMAKVGQKGKIELMSILELTESK
jgi:hypothetical protein